MKDDLKDLEIPFGLYEVMDRSAMILDTFYSVLEEHQAVLDDIEMAHQMEKTGDALMDMYQLAASKFYQLTKDNPLVWERREDPGEEDDGVEGCD